MICTRCRAKAFYEFDGIQFCRDHGETYLFERAYGNAEREVETFFWRVARENQWWYEVPDPLGDRDLDQILDDFSRMPPAERMKRLFGPRIDDLQEIAPAVFASSDAFRDGMRSAQRALDQYAQAMTAFKLPEVTLHSADSVSYIIKTTGIS